MRLGWHSYEFVDENEQANASSERPSNPEHNTLYGFMLVA
jgi:hypothetical protein